MKIAYLIHVVAPVYHYRNICFSYKLPSFMKFHIEKFRQKSVWCNLVQVHISSFLMSNVRLHIHFKTKFPQKSLFAVVDIMKRIKSYDIYLTKFWIQCTYGSSPPLLHWQLPELAAPVTWLLSSVCLEQLSSFWILLECLTTASIIKQYAHVIKKKSLT